MTAPDAREATLREWLLRDSYDLRGSRHHPRCETRSGGACDCYMRPCLPVLEALASLARDARKAVLGQAVVEEAEPLVAAGVVLDSKQEAMLADAIAAYRAEFPASRRRRPL